MLFFWLLGHQAGVGEVPAVLGPLSKKKNKPHISYKMSIACPLEEADLSPALSFSFRPCHPDVF